MKATSVTKKIEGTFAVPRYYILGGSCSIPDDHIDPRRSAFFMARSVLEDIRKEKRDARSTA